MDARYTVDLNKESNELLYMHSTVKHKVDVMVTFTSITCNTILSDLNFSHLA